MDGRWTMVPSASSGEVHLVRGPRPDGPTPVVPCDDAAVGRAIAAMSTPCGLSQTHPDFARRKIEQVVNALRAPDA